MDKFRLGPELAPSPVGDKNSMGNWNNNVNQTHRGLLGFLISMGIGCFNFGQILTRSRIGFLPHRGQKFNGQLESQRKSNTSRTVRIPDFNGNWVLQLWTNSDSVALASSLPPNRVLLMRSRCNLVWWSVIFRGRLSSRLARTLQHAHRALFSTDIAHVVSCANSVLPII